LVSSDNSVHSDIINLSGMRSRLMNIHFPKLKDEVFKKAINDYIFKEVQQFNSKFTDPKQLIDYVDKLNSDLRTFSNYYYKFNGDVDGN
jgi:hypothetical protein